jgi:hypothetical protein
MSIREETRGITTATGGSLYLKLDQSTPQTITGTTGPLINSGYDWAAGNVVYVPLTGDIATYVAAASAGDTLVLAAGNYAITAQINLTQAINIVGQGVGQTTITHTATEATDFTFYATASNVRIANLSIVMNHSVGTTRSGAIRFDGTAGAIITGGMVTNVNITNTTTTAQVEGITFTDASGTVRDCNVTATTSGTNKAANALYFLTNPTAEAASTSYIYNTHATSTGTGTSISSVAFYALDNGSGYDCNVYLYDCNGTGTGTSTMEAGIYANNDNAKMYAYNCIFKGDDYDAAQANFAVVQLSNCTLVNNTTNGTITYDGAIAGEGLTLLSGGDIRPSADSTTALNIAQADGTDFVTFDTTNKRVGVGTTAPGAPFHSVGTAFPTAIFELNNAGSGITTSAFNLYRNQTSPTANDGAGIVFSFNNSSAVKTNFARLAAIATAVTSGAETAAMTFDVGTALAEKMRITSTGLVGIGTTAPLGALHVLSADSDPTDGIGQIISQDSSAVAANVGGSILFKGYHTGTTAGTWGAIKGGKEVATEGDLAAYLSFYSRSASALTERMRITSTGNVGISTTAPSAALDISNGSMALVIGADANVTTRTNNTIKYGRIAGYHYTNTEEPIGAVFTQGLAADNTVSFGGGSSLFNAATLLQFYTAANYTTTTGTERMRINASGQVGIGTTAPNALLDIAWGGVSAGQVPALRIGADLGSLSTRTTATRKIGVITAPHYTNTEEDLGVLSGDSQAAANIVRIGGGASGTNAATDIYFYTAANTTTTTGTSRMVITNDGDTGIGTDTPLSALHVVKQDESTMFLDAYSNTNYAPGVVGRRARGTVASPAAPQSGDFLTGIFGRGYNGSAFTSASNGLMAVIAGETWEAGKNGTYITFETTPNTSTTRAEAMRITGAGLVGIGITAPLSKLHVSVPTGNNAIAITNSSAATNKTWIAYPVTNGVSTDLRFWDTTDRLTLQAGGNIGIGTTAPATKLAVHNNSAAFSTLVIGANGTSVANIADNVDAVSGLQMGNINTGTGADFRFIIKDTTDHYFAFSQPSTGNTAAALFGHARSTADFIFNAGGTTRDLVIGNASAKDLIFGANNTEYMRILSAGNINLPVDSQLLQFGGGQDATISYDGTNMIINPKLVGTGYLSVTGNINANANDIYTTGAVKGVHKAADGTAAVADGTYTMGLGGTTNGTITIKDGIITAVQQCVA